jgi:hypothetical protein
LLKLDKEQKEAIKKRSFNKAFEKTILSHHIDKAFKEFNEDWTFTYEPKKGDLGWHPSGDCMPSVTELYHKADSTLHPEKYDIIVKKDLTHLNKTFMVGHYWHQIIQYLTVKSGLAEEAAIECVTVKDWGESGEPFYLPLEGKDATDPYLGKPFHFVRGQADIAPLVTKDWSGLVDIKTMNSSDFNSGLANSRFAKKYMCQVNIYMDLMSLDQCMIFAVNKDSAKFKEFTFVKDQKLVNQIYGKWEFVGNSLDNNYIPTEDDNKEYALYIGEE